VCEGVLTWQIETGRVRDVLVSGLHVAVALRYGDNRERSPGRFRLYLDDEADPLQQRALEDVFLGRLGGTVLEHFPWAWKESELLGVDVVKIEVEHTRGRQWLRIRDRVVVRIERLHGGPETVTSVIPGHNRAGEEVVAGGVAVVDDGLRFAWRGTTGYSAPGFAYSG
jgi:hypothetical protein